jgi:hypothetical protein
VAKKKEDRLALFIELIVRLLFAALVVYFFDGDLRMGERVAIAVGAIALGVLAGHKRKIQILASITEETYDRLETFIQSQEEEDDESELPRELPDYKCEITIMPDWTKILEHVLMEVNTDIDVEEFMTHFGQEKDYRDCNVLMGKGFHFVQFVSTSGMRVIWSYFHQMFVSEIYVDGHITKMTKSLLLPPYELTEKQKAIQQKYQNCKSIADTFRITPDCIGFLNRIMPYHPPLMGHGIPDASSLATIPFSDILHFFLGVYRHSYSLDPMMAVKCFPAKLQQELDKNGVKYDASYFEDYGTSVEFCADEYPIDGAWTWLKENGVKFYNQLLREHTFTTEFYSVSFSLDFFDV